jgi:hypothetical protein
VYHYNDDPKTPVYEWATTAKSAQDVLRILLMEPSLATTCTRIPTSTCDDVCLLLDTNKLKSREDWKCDDMGAWKNNGVQRHTLSTPITEEDDSENSRDKRTQHTVKRVYLKNKSSPDLTKYVSFLESKSTE